MQVESLQVQFTKVMFDGLRFIEDSRHNMEVRWYLEMQWGSEYNECINYLMKRNRIGDIAYGINTIKPTKIACDCK